jgi:hypothetical protein
MAAERRPARETISYEKLIEFGKTYLKEPVHQQYINEDVVVVVRSHVSFLEAVAPLTKRLNPSSVARMVKEQYKMSHLEANYFGNAMCQAFGYCMKAGGKATTGTKLAKEVLAVYKASLDRAPSADSYVKRRSSNFGLSSQECESPKRAKALKKHISSPSQIDALYSSGSSSMHFKVITYSPWYIKR